MRIHLTPLVAGGDVDQLAIEIGRDRNVAGRLDDEQAGDGARRDRARAVLLVIDAVGDSLALGVSDK